MGYIVWSDGGPPRSTLLSPTTGRSDYEIVNLSNTLLDEWPSSLLAMIFTTVTARISEHSKSLVWTNHRLNHFV